MSEWRQLAEFPDYEISETGSIRRLTDSACARRGYILKPKVDRYGYLTVRPFYNGAGQYVTVHRLVALAFLGDPPTPEHQVAHFDGNQQNNHFTNLRWATAKENQADKARHGRVPCGIRHWKAKLSDAQVAEIRSRYAAGGIRQKDLGAMYGVNQAHVSGLVRGEYRVPA